MGMLIGILVVLFMVMFGVKLVGRAMRFGIKLFGFLLIVGGVFAVASMFMGG